MDEIAKEYDVIVVSRAFALRPPPGPPKAALFDNALSNPQ